MASNGFNRAPSVLEIKNTAAISKLTNESLLGLTSRLDNHESGLNNSAHGIPNIAGLQTALDGKVDDGQVLTNVPVGAVFTDTVYIKPTSEPISYISGLQSALDGKQDNVVGYTGSVTVVTDIDFIAQTTTTKTITYSNGVATNII
jgi:hypothetical protein